MQNYELILIQRGDGRVLSRLPPASQSWGTFGRGELVRCEGRLFPIDQVINQFTNRDAATICSTILLLGAALPDSALGGVTIPEPESMTPPAVSAATPEQSAERRGWWRR